MRADEKFELYEEVKVTQLALDNNIPTPHTTGMVVGFSHDAHCVRILMGAAKYPHTYHMDFWEPIKP